MLNRFRAWLQSHPRHKILFWTTLIGLIFGAIEFGQPVESALQTTRNAIRSQPASGNVVVVTIDDRSIAELGQWPWPRSHHAALVRNLDALGAEKILFDVEFSSPSRPEEDAEFARALSELDNPATVAITYVKDPTSSVRTDLYPIAPIRAHANLASIHLVYNYEGFVWSLPYGVNHGSTAYPSLSAELAGIDAAKLTRANYRVDYSFDLQTVPRVSAVHVLRGAVPREMIAGKRVIIGASSVQLGDLYFAPGHSRVPGVYLHIFGAETLMKGVPGDIGWLAPFLAAVAIAMLAMTSRSNRNAALLFGGGFIAVLGLPLYLDHKLLFTTTAPALFLLISSGTATLWVEARDAYRRRAATNAVSGLPNLSVLRNGKRSEARPMIAAKIRNFAEIVSTLTPQEERHVVEQIAGRFSITETDPTIYQGDEGVFVWFTDLALDSVLNDYLDALHALFRSPVVVSGAPIDLAVTFGIETDFARDAANRLGSALAAAEDATEHGLRWKRHDPTRIDDTRWRMSLLSQLDAAIDGDDVWVAYQPKVELPSGRIVGAEALVRWTHPEKGEISPIEFVLAAEQSGRIDRLTSFVLERAVASAAELNAQGIRFGIAVNISARLIGDPRLAGTVVQILDRYGLDPSLLTLEVTETAALVSGEATAASLRALRDLGIEISIDDYGTGLSTLDYMKKIPATEIKIDKSFVQGVKDSRSDRLMVNSTIQLAHSLGQKVVAEGIEDSETLAEISAMGCDFAQGYFIGKPTRFQNLKERLRKQKASLAA